LRREARERGWEIRDFRSGRKAAKVALPAAMGTVVAVGAVAAGIALSRRRAGAHEAKRRQAGAHEARKP
jgi:hypothetical protein